MMDHVGLHTLVPVLSTLLIGIFLEVHSPDLRCHSLFNCVLWNAPQSGKHCQQLSPRQPLQQSPELRAVANVPPYLQSHQVTRWGSRAREGEIGLMFMRAWWHVVLISPFLELLSFSRTFVDALTLVPCFSLHICHLSLLAERNSPSLSLC